MSMELRDLKESGFLDTEHLLFTAPGLHQEPLELERQLVARIEHAKGLADKIIVVFGGAFCYVNVKEPTRTMNTIIAEQGPGVVRVDATHCMDMLANEADRERIAQEEAGGEKVWWMTTGWVKYRHEVFKGWDKARANENFPKHDGGSLVLDAVGYCQEYMEEHTEELLEYSDWMGIPMRAQPITLDRFKSLLTNALGKLDGV
jgi:hypothetical protein